MLIATRRTPLALCPVVVALLVIGCSDSTREPTTAPDTRPLFESGSGSDGSGGGSGGGSGSGSGDGGGTTTPTTGTGQVQIVQGGTGQGSITSQPAGINCTIGPAGPDACAASFAAGTRVRLEARAAEGSEFRGWALTTSCQKAPDVTVIANAVHSCQPVFQPKS